jgi:hypothetical protein
VFQLECMVSYLNLPYPMMKPQYCTSNEKLLGLTLFVA